MSKLENIDLDKVPEEPLGTPISFVSNYYQCPKCKGSVRGIFGIKDKKGKAWALSECEECGYIYKVNIWEGRIKWEKKNLCLN